MTISDYPDYQTPQAHADRIANTGAPLLNLPTLLDKLSSQVLTGGQSLLRGPFAFNQPAYDIVVEAEIAAGATAPYLAVELSWIDTNTMFDIMEENFYLGVTSNGVNVYGGRGQSKGDNINVELINLDPAKSITLSYSLIAHSRIPPRTDWRTQAFNGITGVTSAPSDPASGVVLSVNQSITNGTPVTFAVPLYTGKVKLSVAEVPQAGRVVVRNAAVTAAQASVTSSFTYDSGAIASGAAFTDDVALGMSTQTIEVLNNGSAAGTFIVVMTAEDF